MSNEDKAVEIFRLAYREEGEFVNCYFARPATEKDAMKDAILLASVRRSVLEEEGMFDCFKLMMQLWISTTTKNIFGVEPSHFEESPAPEHEKAGNV